MIGAKGIGLNPTFLGTLENWMKLNYLNPPYRIFRE